jgi:hypothetical protein
MMAAGTKTDFKIYNDQYYGGYFETQQQNVDAFNAASNGTINLVTQGMLGDFEQEAFIKALTGTAQRRDVTSVAPVTDNKLTMGELVGVKLNRRHGPIAQTADAFKKIGQDAEEMSYIIGQMAAGDESAEQLNTAIAAVNAALSGVAGLTVDVDVNLTHIHLSQARGKFGDKFNRVKIWVMHSAVFHSLIGTSIGMSLDSVAGVAIYQGTTGSLGLPVLVTDSPSLVVANGGGAGVDEYITLGLVDNAVTVTNSEDRELIFEKLSGFENIMYRYQAEFAYNLNIAQFSWDMAGGGANPTASAVASAGNWLNQSNSTKNLPGVRIRSRAS